MIDTTQLHTELETAGLPVVGVSSDGRIDYARDLTPAEQTTADAVVAAHDPTKRERDERTARDAAKDAANNLNLYLDLTIPTNAQSIAAIKLLIRVVLWLLRNEFRT